MYLLFSAIAYATAVCTTRNGYVPNWVEVGLPFFVLFVLFVLFDLSVLFVLIGSRRAWGF